MGELKTDISKNIFGNTAKKYITKGYSVIPDKYMSKMPAIKGWSKYSYELPTMEEINSWSHNIPENGIALLLGEASGIICLDVDSTDLRILDVILPVLPPSPVEKKGAKGFSRFFRYSGEQTEVFKHNGEVVFELLSNNKKTTLPPSIHPNGETYTWTDKALLEVDKNDLPLLPPFLVAHLQDKIRNLFPETETVSRGKTFNGRNNDLSALCGELIRDGVPMDEAVSKLIEKDKEHEIPLFSDANEFGHTEPYTNALVFYANHLNTANSKHYRKSEEYEIPITASAVTQTQAKEVLKGKSQRQGSPKRLNRGSLLANFVNKYH